MFWRLGSVPTSGKEYSVGQNRWSWPLSLDTRSDTRHYNKPVMTETIAGVKIKRPTLTTYMRPYTYICIITYLLTYLLMELSAS
jgi:hypothetical protein